MPPLLRPLAPTEYQQPFQPYLADEQREHLKGLCGDDIDKRNAALDFFKITVNAADKTVVFSGEDKGFPLQDKEAFTFDEGRYTARPVDKSNGKQTRPFKTEPLFISWDGQSPLGLTFDDTATNLHAATLTYTNEDGKKIAMPLDGIGTIKPGGFVSGSQEGGPAEGPHCYRNSVRLQAQLMVANAMGVGEKGLEHISEKSAVIDEQLHDRLQDAKAMLAIALGGETNAWEYTRNLGDKAEKGTVGACFEKTGEVPESFFKKLLGVNATETEQAKAGKFTPEKINKELERIGDDALKKAYKENGADGLVKAMMERQSKTREAQAQEAQPQPFNFCDFIQEKLQWMRRGASRESTPAAQEEERGGWLQKTFPCMFSDGAESEQRSGGRA